jgi:ribosomal protein S18 acetylase RimI-like enzyme
MGEIFGLQQTMLTALRNPETTIFNSFKEELQSWPAHFHINVLPQYQRQHIGSHLVNTFCNNLATATSGAVHVSTRLSNERALTFFEKLGFERLPHNLDGGETDLLGQTNSGHNGREAMLYLVRKS